MKKIIPITLLFAMSIFAPIKATQGQSKKESKIIVSDKTAQSLREKYVQPKDTFFINSLKSPNLSVQTKENLAFMKIMQQNKAECQKLLNQYISAPQVSKNYWQQATDSLSRLGKIVL